MFTIQHPSGAMIEIPPEVEAQGGAAIDAFTAAALAALPPTPPDEPAKAPVADSPEE